MKRLSDKIFFNPPKIAYWEFPNSSTNEKEVSKTCWTASFVFVSAIARTSFGLRSACRPPVIRVADLRRAVRAAASDCGGISSCADIPRRLLPSFLTNDAGVAGRTKGRAGPFSGPARTGESCAFAGGCGIGRDDRASRAVSDRRGGEEPGFVMTSYEKMTRIVFRSSADRSARDGEEMESSGNITGRSPSRSTPSLLGGAWCSLWRLGWFSAGIPRCRARGRTIASALRNWRRIWRPPALRGRGLP